MEIPRWNALYFTRPSAYGLDVFRNPAGNDVHGRIYLRWQGEKMIEVFVFTYIFLVAVFVIFVLFSVAVGRDDLL